MSESACLRPKSIRFADQAGDIDIKIAYFFDLKPPAKFLRFL